MILQEPKHDFDVAILGNGLSGSMLATILGKKGVSVVLIDADRHSGKSGGEVVGIGIQMLLVAPIGVHLFDSGRTENKLDALDGGRVAQRLEIVNQMLHSDQFGNNAFVADGGQDVDLDLPLPMDTGFPIHIETGWFRCFLRDDGEDIGEFMLFENHGAILIGLVLMCKRKLLL